MKYVLGSGKLFTESRRQDELRPFRATLTLALSQRERELGD